MSKENHQVVQLLNPKCTKKEIFEKSNRKCKKKVLTKKEFDFQNNGKNCTF